MTANETKHKDDVTLRRKLRSLRKAADDLRLLTPTDSLLADVCGELRSVEVKIAEQRHRYERLAREMEPIVEFDRDNRVDPTPRVGAPVAQGKKFELVPKFKTNRTYNGPRILVELGETLGVGPFDALRVAMENDAVRLAWRWTDLKKLLKATGTKLYTSPDPVSEHDGLDAAMVGEEVVPNGFDRVPIKEPTS